MNKRKTAFKLVPANERGCIIGENHPRARLSDDDVSLIIELRALGLKLREIAAKFDDFEPPIAVTTVGDICAGRRRGQSPRRWVKRYG
jgi:hypothetical protein